MTSGQTRTGSDGGGGGGGANGVIFLTQEISNSWVVTVFLQDVGPPLLGEWPNREKV